MVPGRRFSISTSARFEQLVQDRLIVRILEIERDRFLAAVLGDEIARTCR